MNIRNIFKRNNTNTEQIVADTERDTYNERLWKSAINAQTALKLSTVYRCVELLSNSVAQLTAYPYSNINNHKRVLREHSTYNLLAIEPNRRMTKYTFFKQLVQDLLLAGNAYAYIERDITNKPAALHYIPCSYVSINEPVNLFDDITYIIAGLPQLIEHKDIIHLLNYSNDGVRGVSTIHYANQSLDIATESELAANQNLNSNVTGLLSVESALSADQIKQAKKAWNQNVMGNSGGGIAVLSGGWKFQQLNLSSTDLQLIESREFNATDVARWFGVPGSKLGITKSVSYNSIEAEQLAFLSDTLHPLLQKIECELERKLYTNSEREYIDVRFDIKPILRIDQKSQSEYFRTLFNIGVLTINEIRNELDLSQIDGGDNVLMQTNMSTLNNIIKPNLN